jgi:hypothetical protein
MDDGTHVTVAGRVVAGLQGNDGDFESRIRKLYMSPQDRLPYDSYLNRRLLEAKQKIRSLGERVEVQPVQPDRIWLPRWQRSGQQRLAEPGNGLHLTFVLDCTGVHQNREWPRTMEFHPTRPTPPFEEPATPRPVRKPGHRLQHRQPVAACDRPAATPTKRGSRQ